MRIIISIIILALSPVLVLAAILRGEMSDYKEYLKDSLNDINNPEYFYTWVVNNYHSIYLHGCVSDVWKGRY